MKDISTLSILIVTWNGDDLLANCLKSIEVLYGASPEIVVVDNANTPSTRDIVDAHSNAKYIASPDNLGFAGGNNLGLPHCTRPYVLLLNNDTLIHEDSLAPLVTYLQSHENVGAVQGTMKLPYQNNAYDVCGYFMTPFGIRYTQTAPKPGPILSGKGAFLMFSKNALSAANGILFHDFYVNNHEEIDFCHRLWLAGYEVHFVDTPAISHLNSQTFAKISDRHIQTAARMCANGYSSLFTNLGAKNLWKIGIPSLLMDTTFFAAMVLSGKWKKASVYPKALCIFLSRAKKLCALRRQIQCSRQSSDAEIFGKVWANPPLAHYWNAIRGRSESFSTRRSAVRAIEPHKDDQEMAFWREMCLSASELRELCFQTVQADTPPFSHREAAIAWARDHGVIGELSCDESGGKGTVLISTGSLREMLNPVQIKKSSSIVVHFAAVAVLRELIQASHIVERYFDRKKGIDGIRHPENGLNVNVLIEVGYASMFFDDKPYRVKLTLKRFADANTPAKAYAYHVTQIEVLAGTIGNDLSDTAPNANTPITNQAKAYLRLTGDSLLNGVRNVNGELLLP